MTSFSPGAPAHDTPPAPASQSFTAELSDALNPRGVLLIVGVFALGGYAVLGTTAAVTASALRLRRAQRLAGT
ncbi:hypothetical protein [Streptomyces sp. NPDC088794]|uniref:hypothetical protein n=1 Tax=Streptomyces sp. NPDC088794 TaxID=3365902 RepID=UPI00380D8089